MNFRTAVLEDIEQVCDLVRLSIIHMEQQHIFQWDGIYPAREDFIKDIHNGELFVGQLNGNIAVIYTINKRCEKEYQNGQWNNPNCEYRIIHRLCVHPDLQNQGLAKATLFYIEEQLRAMKVDAIRLDVFSKNPAVLALYSNCGYKKTGFADWRKGRFFLMEKYLFQ